MLQQATFGGGCFWCTEAVFQELRGVREAVSGYSGGSIPNPSYEQICSGTTGHAEVVQVTFDPDKISYPELLAVFFATHDPTTLNQQGADRGTQYRSIILYHNEQQRELAEAAIRELDASGQLSGPVVTQVEPVREFYPAEAYHQDYFDNNPAQPYCLAVIPPKLKKLQALFADLLTSPPEAR